MKNKVLLLICTFGALLATASAQTTLATIPQQQRGPFTAAKLPVSGYLIPVDANQIIITTSIGATDLANSANLIEVDMEASDDGGQTYNHCLSADGTTTCAGFTWEGGQINPKTGQPWPSPVMVFDCQGLRGITARLSITLSRKMSIGATVQEN